MAAWLLTISKDYPQHWDYAKTHAVAYFCPEVKQAAEDAGLRGFWAGYFAFRAAPLGPCPAAVVTATFFGFHPDRAARVVPAVWEACAPERAKEARRTSAAAVLRRQFGAVGIGADPTDVADALWDIAQRVPIEGRPLTAANRALPRPTDPHERLWQATTTLREHRGDGHLAALVAAGAGPVEANLLKLAAGEAEEAWLARSRGWPAEDWQAGWARLADAGLTTGRALTPAGVDLHTAIEETTDRLAAAPWAHLPPAELDDLAAALTPLTRAVLASGELPDDNPIGLGRVSTSE